MECFAKLFAINPLDYALHILMAKTDRVSEMLFCFGMPYDKKSPPTNILCSEPVRID
jgi:hypothetical protein